MGVDEPNNAIEMVFGQGGKLKRCRVCMRQTCECGTSAAPKQQARNRAESQSALDADIRLIETTPRSSKNNVADTGPDDIPGNPLACNPDREETDSGFAQNDRVEHAKRGVGTVIGFFGEFVKVQYDTGPVGQHKYTHSKARKALVFSSKKGAAPSEAPAPPAQNDSSAPAVSGSQKIVNGRCSECMRRADLCSCVFDEEEAEEEPSPSPIRAKPTRQAPKAAPEPYKAKKNEGNDILGIGGAGSDDEELERDETDSGFAQWDRVKHTKRGLGKVIGFFGEFVMVQYDDEPHGRHKYTWDQAKKKVSIIGWEPPQA